MGIFAATPVAALTMTEAVARARLADPAYLSAQANLAGAQARVKQALGAMGPQLSASLTSNDNRRRYATLGSTRPPNNDAYNSKNAQLSLTLPLVRRVNTITFDQAELVATQADLQRAAAEQDLLVRLSQAWFDAMQARDHLASLASLVAATAWQHEQLAHALSVGLGGIPAAEEARYKHEQALADQFSAQADLGARMAVLEQIVGPLPDWTPPSLGEHARLAMLEARRLDDWLAQAEENSPAVAAAQNGLAAAEAEVRKQRAGHDPTLDLVASLGKNGQGEGGFPGQSGYEIKQNAVGLQLNVPLFSSGTQNAKVREALATRDKARQDLEQARRTVRTGAKQAWLGWQAGLAQQAAARQGVRYSSVALDAAEAGQAGALKSQLDVLQTRQQRDAIARDLQKARYQTITSQAKLKASVGLLSDADLTAFDAWLEPNAMPEANALDGGAAQRGAR